jgi:hypothetical protein
MLRLHRFHRFAHWAALAALVWAAVFPTLSMALATPAQRNAWAQGAEWHEVCTAQGTRWVSSAGMAAASDESPASQGLGHPAEHCPYCSLQGANAPLVSRPLSLHDASADRQHEHPLAFWQAPRLLFAWTTLQARAPPLSA